ncbi:MAG: thioredoxin family protein [Actinomycetota bacterium]|nr:thioredoxin family protein [Actinomycetota bacterium]MDK1102613.1 thioredoxin family protein [Actinomycetota bacterium]
MTNSTTSYVLRLLATHLRTLRHTPLKSKSRFRESSTVLIDGADPFADLDSPVGLSCRIHVTVDGMAGSPSLGQLREATAASSAEA